MSGSFLRHVVALPLFNSHDQAVFVNPRNAARAGLVRGLDPPPSGPRSGDTAVLFCACVASAGWARLSGAARFSATKPVTGGRPNVSTTRDALPVPPGQGVSPVLRFVRAVRAVPRRSSGSGHEGHAAAAGDVQAVGVGAVSRVSKHTPMAKS